MSLDIEDLESEEARQPYAFWRLRKDEACVTDRALECYGAMLPRAAEAERAVVRALREELATPNIEEAQLVVVANGADHKIVTPCTDLAGLPAVFTDSEYSFVRSTAVEHRPDLAGEITGAIEEIRERRRLEALFAAASQWVADAAAQDRTSTAVCRRLLAQWQVMLSRLNEPEWGICEAA